MALVDTALASQAVVPLVFESVFSVEAALTCAVQATFSVVAVPNL